MRASSLWPALTIAALLLTACRQPGASRVPLPTVVLGKEPPSTDASRSPSPSSTAGVVAAARIVPARQVELSAVGAGRVVALPFAEGDAVAAGDLLLALEDDVVAAQAALAQAALHAAQANHALLLAGPSAEALQQAQAALDGAQAHYDALAAGPRPEQVAQAQANLASAQAALGQLQSAPDDLAVQRAHLGVAAAKDALWAAQSERDVVCGNAALAGAQCDGARARVLVAETSVGLAENQLAIVERGADPAEVERARQAVRSAEAQLALARQPATRYDLAAAQAQVDAARAALAALQAGPRRPELAAAEAQVEAAQAQVQSALALQEQLSLRAPFDGVLTRLSAELGQWLLPGQAAAALADLDTLLAETTDLGERDVPRVAVGQPVTVTVEALGVDIAGRVQAIAPLADTLGGDVVYRVTILLEERPASLRAGMSAQVAFR